MQLLVASKYVSLSIANGLQTDKIHRIDVTIDYHDGELKEKQQNSSQNQKTTARFLQMTKNWKDKKLEGIQYALQHGSDMVRGYHACKDIWDATYNR